jgi:hypothetical protein
MPCLACIAVLPVRSKLLIELLIPHRNTSDAAAYSTVHMLHFVYAFCVL